MHLLLLLSTLLVVAAEVPPCDPETQYVQNDQCCKKCGPGTKMTSGSTCLDPKCENCKDGEYRDAYTILDKCLLQPYCDQNKNFEVPVKTSKTEESTCVCKQGYTCLSKLCVTCMQHAKCGPGYGVQSKGNHTHDTLCRPCPDGTFSDETSEADKCKKRTDCVLGSHIKREGTATSDNICEQTLSRHVRVIILAVVLAASVVIVLGFFLVYKRKGKKTNSKADTEDCEEASLQEKPKIDHPTPDPDPESFISEAQVSQEEDMRTPVEDMEEETAIPHLTDNGNYVTEEYGKEAILSRQESQTTTIPSLIEL
ncbi:tumor necrosis factor receptor superfamily member 5 [Genypterus blacodes]|uniref:tumor necrosis factor receptor superfamily member 5 n=1 Tax=Genypterus blacodes TaxID=154954 RepID=UPI003F763366